MSPHWEGIQYEFGRAFEIYHLEKTGKAIRVRWRDLGGTSQIEKALDATFQNTPESARIDIFFGGGIDPYENQKRKGQLHSYRLPDTILNQIPAEVAGFPLVDEDFNYYGAALSSFGILENVRVIEKVGLPAVKDWADLGHPELFGWVSSSDPRKSGSVHMIYEIILQAYGWEKGWAVINTMSGNVKSFLQSSSSPTKEVSVGDAAYAVSIDINGMTQQAYLGKSNVRFFIPEGVSVINPDGIAILKGAPNLPAAERFLEFVMSDAGQSLWMKPTGTPGGATRYGISRMGVLPSFYEGGLEDLLVPLNPFAITHPFRYDGKTGSRRWSLLNDLIGSTIIDVHSHLRTTWAAILDAPEPLRSELVHTFSLPPISEAESIELARIWRSDPIRARRLTNQWMQDSVAKYRTLRQKALDPVRSTPARATELQTALTP
ncbi:MAG: ABC transporter substrate-binding protein [Candidatus Methylacidiphilales bacterium]